MADLNAALTPISDLECVNGMLALIGEAPVTTITDTGQADVNLATQCLRNNSRSIQARGWSFNRDTGWRMTRSAEGYINIPSNALVAAPTEGQGIEGVQRGTKLWDKSNHTFKWNLDVSMDFVWFLPFTDLPEHARHFVYASAALDFAKSQMATAQILRAAEQFFVQAKVEFAKVERRIRPMNVYRDSTTAMDLYRNPDFIYTPGQ
jgi:hypothetical protein